MSKTLETLTYPLRFLDFLAFEAHVRGMRTSRGVPDAEIDKYVALWKSDCAYFELALSKRQVYADGDTVPIPGFVEKPDYEFEIGCLLGRETAANMTDAEAEDFFRNHCRITILNDFSARDFQEKDRNLGLGVARSKSIIGKAIGPEFVPASSFDLRKSALSLRVNGEERTKTTYSTSYWTFPKIFAHLSRQNILLDAGTIVGSGTIGGGCIAEHGGKYPWLKTGDAIEMSVEGVGILRNTITIR